MDKLNISRSGDKLTREDVIEKIKEYLKRLKNKDNLESVRADFVKEFKEVDASEIMLAEQRLLKEGTPLEEVQKLCDVHSALFHGKTTEERILNAEKAANQSVKEKRMAATKKLISISGHPLYTFTRENEKIEQLVERCMGVANDGNIEKELLTNLRQIAIHYAKKGDLLYPHLKVKYDISGPSDVMWTVDDEIRDEITKLYNADEQDNEWKERFKAVLIRIKEMIYKEANILFPNCALNFTETEWYDIYIDSKDYEKCLDVENVIWEEAEKAYITKKKKIVEDRKVKEDEIVMAGGTMTVEQLAAMLNTIPLEITFVDIENINRYFNEDPKVFKRPEMAIGREVFSCHPPKVEKQVRRIIEEFKSGNMDKVPVWMEKNGRTMLVTYMAVRNEKKDYLGTVELVQDMEFVKEHFKL